MNVASSDGPCNVLGDRAGAAHIPNHVTGPAC